MSRTPPPPRQRLLDSGSVFDVHPEWLQHVQIPLFRKAIWMILVGSGVFMLLLAWTSPREYAGRIVATAGLIVLSLTALQVLRRAGPVQATRLLALGSWVLAIVASTFGEGLRTPILLALPLMLVFSGWLLGARFSVLMFVASNVIVVAMGLAQHVGILVPVTPVPVLVVAVAHLIVLGIAFLLTVYLLRLFHERYAEEHRLAAEVRNHLQAVQEREADLRTLADHLPGPVFEADRDGRCRFANERFAEIFGRSRDSLPGLSIEEIIGRNASVEFKPHLAAVQRGEVVEFLARKRTPDKVWHMYDISLVPRHAADGDEVIGWYGVMHDVTRREQTVAELRDQATHDPLTGLGNRIFLAQRLNHAVERAARTDSRVGVLLIDLDHFKEINDTLGHNAGDQVLVAVARRLESATRAADTIARLGGDEFIALLENVPDGTTAESVAGKILAELTEPVMIDASPAHVGGSIGIALYPDDGRCADALVAAADAAMYEAKAAGRNCHRRAPRSPPSD